MRKVNYTKELLEEKVKDCYSFAEERNFYRSSLKFECPMRNHRSRISLIKQLKNVSRNTLQSLVSLLSF